MSPVSRRRTQLADFNDSYSTLVLLYPGVAEISKAEQFDIAEGERRVVDFALRLPRLSRVSGIALDVEGQLVRRGDVVAMPRGEVAAPNYGGLNIQRGRIDRGGNLTIRNLVPGKCSLRANVEESEWNGNVRRFMASPFTVVTVSGEGVANVRLLQPPLATVSGRVTFDTVDMRRLGRPRSNWRPARGVMRTLGCSSVLPQIHRPHHPKP
jgi:hypothetical protein